MRIAALICCLLPLLTAAQPVVPGFDRFPHDTPASQIAAGEVLINELNCIACHTADKQQSHRFEARQAPVLFTTHNPASAGWLKRWLNDPHNLKPGTLMPDLLHGLDKKDKANVVEALRHYLASLTPPLGNRAVLIGDANKGKKATCKSGLLFTEYFSNKKIAYNSTYKSSVATKSQVNEFLNFIIKNLDKKGFLQPNHKRKSMLRNINNIFHRMNLSEQEIRILLGIFSTLNEFNKKS